MKRKPLSRMLSFFLALVMCAGALPAVEAKTFFPEKKHSVATECDESSSQKPQEEGPDGAWAPLAAPVAGVAEAEAQLDRMLNQAAGLTAGRRYPQQRIDGILAALAQARTDLAAEGSDPESVLADAQAAFEAFLRGAGDEKLSFHVLSDIHVGYGSSELRDLQTGLADMAEINPGADAFVSVGDNTQYSTEQEYADFYGALQASGAFPVGNALVALGNHDVRGPSGAKFTDPITGEELTNVWEAVPDKNIYWNTAYTLYMEYNAPYRTDEGGKTYFDRWINGYHFIVLNTEAAAKDSAWMTAEQLAWFEEKLTETESGAGTADPSRPVFVVIHQSLNDTHWRGNGWGGFGPSDGEMKQILSRHPQAVLLTGHIHNGFGVAEVMQTSCGTLVDIPSYTQSANGVWDDGIGYEVYVYDDEIYFSARNFVTHTWLPEYDVCVKLPTISALYRDGEGLDSNDYTVESWARYEAARETARGFLTRQYQQAPPDPNVGPQGGAPAVPLYGPETQAAIRAAQAELASARDGLMRDEAAKYVVSGTVTDSAAGAPVPGVRVWAASQETVTDEAGGYALTLRTGAEYTIKAAAEGYWDGALTVKVDGADLAGQDIVLENSAAQKRQLAELVAKGESMVKADYEGDWDSFQSALAAAKTVAGDLNATRAQVVEACEALQAAISALTKKAFAVTGTVTWGGKPVAGAAVTLETTAWVPVVSTVTDGLGVYILDELSVADYKLKIAAPGFETQTLDVTGASIGDTIAIDVPLRAQGVAHYALDFDDADASMLQGLPGSDEDSFRIQPVPMGDGGAVQLTFDGSATRSTSNIILDGIQIENGTVYLDVTPQEGGVQRFGVNLRTTAGNSRIFVGLFDTTDKWTWDYYNTAGGNGYLSSSGRVKGPALLKGVTRSLKITLNGDRLSLWVDGVLLMNETVVASGSTALPQGAGYIGFVQGNSGNNVYPGSFVIDNLRIVSGDTPAAGSYPIAGMVQDGAGAPIPGVRVTVGQDERPVVRTVTAADGSFATAALAEGDYRVELSAPGYLTASVTAQLSGKALELGIITLEVDKNRLQALYDQHRDRPNEGYTDESWAAFQNALAQAERALEEGTPAEVEAACAALSAAADDLTKRPPEPLPDGDTGSGTETVEHEDGSVTTIVTDLSSGTVVETTCWPDGRSRAVEIKRNGDRTVVVKRADGSTAVEIALPAQPAAPENSFSDIPGGHWSEAAANELAGLGIITGTAAGVFGGDAPLTRGALVTILHRLSGSLPGYENPFTDVADGRWYTPAIAWAADTGIVLGVGGGRFAPDDKLTREALAAVLCRYASLLGMDTRADVMVLEQFADGGKTGGWANGAMCWAVQNGIVQGNGGRLNPGGTATRAEAAVMLRRFLELLRQ